MEQYGFVMLVRANDKFKPLLNKFKDNAFIYSQWYRYLNSKNEDYKKIQEFVPENYIYLHTSGHATPDAITDKAILLDDEEELYLGTEEKNS